ncbi:hypothetical protein [Streptomyces sp. NPDC002845]
MTVVEILSALSALGYVHIADRLEDYAEVAERAALIDRESLRSCAGSESLGESLVITDVLGDKLLSALRRLAQTGQADTPAGDAAA